MKIFNVLQVATCGQRDFNKTLVCDCLLSHFLAIALQRQCSGATVEDKLSGGAD
jgi:hypothetical protein